MSSRVPAVALGLASLLFSVAGQAQSPQRLNPMIALHETGLPVFGITHPAIVAGRGRGPNAAPAPEAPPPPLPSLVDAARETVAYPYADFAYDNYAPANAERFLGYMGAMLAAGGSVRQHAFISKVPIIHTDPAVATARIVEQLNAGHVGVMLQEVESADEVRAGLAAMRFKSKGGSRPDDGVGLAAAYWKLSEAEYRAEGRPLAAQQAGRTGALGHRREQEGHRQHPRDRAGAGTHRHRRRCRARWAASTRLRARTASGCAIRPASTPA